MWNVALLGVGEALEQLCIVVGAVEDYVPLCEGALKANGRPL